MMSNRPARGHDRVWELEIREVTKAKEIEVEWVCSHTTVEDIIRNRKHRSKWMIS